MKFPVLVLAVVILLIAVAFTGCTGTIGPAPITALQADQQLLDNVTALESIAVIAVAMDPKTTPATLAKVQAIDVIFQSQVKAAQAQIDAGSAPTLTAQVSALRSQLAAIKAIYVPTPVATTKP